MQNPENQIIDPAAVEFDAGNQDSPGNEPQVETVTQPETPRRIEDAVSPILLEMLADASDGFRFQADPNLPPGQTGYTDKRTKTIYYNPLLLQGSPEHGIKPWRNEDILGFTSHEAGHHAPAVLDFDKLLIKDLGNPDIIPEAYRGSPAAETRFFNALFRHLDNGLIDIWLESYMGRTPFIPIREAITGFQSAKGEWEDYRPVSKPEQLMQVMLRSRYIDQKGLEDKLDPDVYEAFQEVMKSKAINTLMEKRAHENYFATPADRKRAIDKKFQAYQQVFLPTYLRLLENELEERKQERQKQKQEGNEQGEQGQEGEESQGEEGQQGQGEQQRRQSNEGVPMTKEEEQEIAQQIIEELEKAGEEFGSLAPSEDDKEQVRQKFSQIQQMLQKMQEQKESGEKSQPVQSKEEPEREHGLEELQRTMRQLMREKQQKDRLGLAEKHKVGPEAIQKWQRIKEEQSEQIRSTATALSEIFLDDRRKKMEFLVREGEIVPGLEFETVAAMLSGDSDPDTRMREVGNPQFMETEIEFIVDKSGSMHGNKIDRSVEMMVVTTEAFKQTLEVLDAESLLMEDEEPFRIGLTTFSDEPERVTTLDEPLDDRKEIVIIDQASRTGGGTRETEAIESVYHQLKLRQNHVAKIVVVLTDGQGEGQSLAPIMRQIEEDDEVSFLAVGLGDDEQSAQAIAETYTNPLAGRGKNVFTMAAPHPEQILPGVLNFLRTEIDKRRKF